MTLILSVVAIVHHSNTHLLLLHYFCIFESTTHFLLVTQIQYFRILYVNNRMRKNLTLEQENYKIAGNSVTANNSGSPNDQLIVLKKWKYSANTDMCISGYSNFCNYFLHSVGPFGQRWQTWARVLKTRVSGFDFKKRMYYSGTVYMLYYYKGAKC